MKPQIKREDHSVLAQLYDAYRSTYPQSRESVRQELESAYQEVFGESLENSERIATIVGGIFDEQSRYVHEHGVCTGVHLALDLELDSSMHGYAHMIPSHEHPLVSHVRVSHPDIIQMDHELTPDVEQEELPY